MMLILIRKPGESIQTGDNIKITILDDKHNQIKIRIDAPEDVEIWRDEICDQIKEPGDE